MAHAQDVPRHANEGYDPLTITAASAGERATEMSKVELCWNYFLGYISYSPNIDIEMPEPARAYECNIGIAGRFPFNRPGTWYYAANDGQRNHELMSLYLPHGQPVETRAFWRPPEDQLPVSIREQLDLARSENRYAPTPMHMDQAYRARISASTFWTKADQTCHVNLTGQTLQILPIPKHLPAHLMFYKFGHIEPKNRLVGVVQLTPGPSGIVYVYAVAAQRPEHSKVEGGTWYLATAEGRILRSLQRLSLQPMVMLLWPENMLPINVVQELNIERNNREITGRNVAVGSEPRPLSPTQSSSPTLATRRTSINLPIQQISRQRIRSTSNLPVQPLAPGKKFDRQPVQPLGPGTRRTVRSVPDQQLVSGRPRERGADERDWGAIDSNDANVTEMLNMEPRVAHDGFSNNYAAPVLIVREPREPNSTDRPARVTIRGVELTLSGTLERHHEDFDVYSAATYPPNRYADARRYYKAYRGSELIALGQDAPTRPFIQVPDNALPNHIRVNIQQLRDHLANQAQVDFDRGSPDPSDFQTGPDRY